MTNFYLAMYNFKIKINKGEYLELDKIPVEENYRKNNGSKYISFKDICKIIFKEKEFVSEDLEVCKVEESEDPFFHAKLGLAEYGNKRGLYDGENEIEMDPIEQNHKVLEPFFFMFCMPSENNNKNGFFVIEKKKSKPIIKKFNKMIINQLKEINSELRIIFESHVPNELNQVVTDGIVKEFVFTIYENEKDKFDEKNLSKIKLTMPALKKISPIDVDENSVINRAKSFVNNINLDNKFKMKVGHGNNQEVTLDIEELFNPNVFYLRINEEITTVNDNPKYDSMVEVSKKYIKSNFQYYIDKEDKSKLEK